MDHSRNRLAGIGPREPGREHFLPPTQRSSAALFPSALSRFQHSPASRHEYISLRIGCLCLRINHESFACESGGTVYVSRGRPPSRSSALFHWVISPSVDMATLSRTLCQFRAHKKEQSNKILLHASEKLVHKFGPLSVRLYDARRVETCDDSCTHLLFLFMCGSNRFWWYIYFRIWCCY